jgi:hypothetical protein
VAVRRAQQPWTRQGRKRGTRSPPRCCKSPSTPNASPPSTSAKRPITSNSSVGSPNWPSNWSIPQTPLPASRSPRPGRQRSSAHSTALDQQVAALAAKLTDLVPTHAHGEDVDDDSYQPAPTARWWKLTGDDRDQALTRLRAWVEQIYRPGFGHLAAALGLCWDQHPLCLYGLDWLMELWSILYLAPARTAGTIASQAEWQTRLLPALAEQMYLETTRCPHARQPGPQPPPAHPSRRAGPAYGEPRGRSPRPLSSMNPPSWNGCPATAGVIANLPVGGHRQLPSARVSRSVISPGVYSHAHRRRSVCSEARSD